MLALVGWLWLVEAGVLGGYAWLHKFGFLSRFKAEGVGCLLLAVVGMFGDQQYGLFFYSPWLALGLGCAWAARRRLPPHLWRGCVAVVATLIGIVVAWRWIQWDGGFTPPGRFLAPTLIPLGLWAAVLVARSGSRIDSMILSLAGEYPPVESCVYDLPPVAVPSQNRRKPPSGVDRESHR